MALQPPGRIAAKNLCAWLSIAVMLPSCIQDGGYQSPSDPRNLSALGEYVGTVPGGDSAAVARILTQSQNPRLEVMWRSVGMRDDFTVGQSSVELALPLTIRISLLQPPPAKVLRGTTITFGLMTLYMDVNGNGRFDRAMYPGFEPAYERLDSLTAQVQATRAALVEAADTGPKRTVSDTLLIDAALDLVAKRGNTLDTLIRMLPFEIDKDSLLPIRLASYQRILRMEDRWEVFFASRKKDNEFFRLSFPMPGWYRAVEIRYERNLWPKPGREAEFWDLFRKAVVATYAMERQSQMIYGEFAASGKMEYPFQGYAEPGQDWIAGRAITDLLLFIPEQATLDSLRRALPTSTFRVEGMERVRVGYNLFHCDDQYVCTVKAPGDTVVVLAGSTEEFFNAPPSPITTLYPEKVAGQPPALPASALARIEGSYVLNGSDTLAFAVRGGKAWCWFPGEGLRRVEPVDSNGFQNRHSYAQGIFTAGLWGNPDRVIQYAVPNRNSYLRVSNSVPRQVLDGIARLENIVPVRVPDSVLDRHAGAYTFGADTLVLAHTGGDSLAMSLKGYRNLGFHPVSDTLFVSPWGDWRLEFPGCGGERCRSLVMATGAWKKTVPAAGDSPSNRLRSSSVPAVGPVWGPAEGGTGDDDFTGPSGKGRYGCSQDGAFLRPGDGAVAAFARTRPGDGISLLRGDAALFRIEGMRGKRAALELRNCADKAAKGKRIWVSAWGGSDPERLAPLPGGRGWLAVAAAGAYWTVDSIAVDADPYYLRLVEEDTRDAPFFNAFDGYRLGERP